MARTRSVPYDHAAACSTLAAKDKKLAQLMAQAGPFTLRLKPTESPFEALLESIIHQQLHGKAAKTIHDRVLALFPENQPQAEALLLLPQERLRAAGLSANKAAALRDLAEKTSAGIVPSLSALRRMSDENVIEHLTQVRGIGVWTVEMLLIFRLGRPNVLPVDDYGVRKGFALTFQGLRLGTRIQPSDLPDAATMRRRAARWQPWCSVASWYLWRACDLERTTLVAASNKVATEKNISRKKK